MSAFLQSGSKKEINFSRLSCWWTWNTSRNMDLGIPRISETIPPRNCSRYPRGTDWNRFCGNGSSFKRDGWKEALLPKAVRKFSCIWPANEVQWGLPVYNGLKMAKVISRLGYQYITNVEGSRHLWLLRQLEDSRHSSKKFQIFKFRTWIGFGKVNRRGLDLLLFFQVLPSSDVVFMLPADEV